MTTRVPSPPEAAPQDIRPVVARSGGQIPIAVLFGGVAVGGLLLFLALDSHRRQITAPAAPLGAPGMSPAAALPPLPPLYLPASPRPAAVIVAAVPATALAPPAPPAPPPAPTARPPETYTPRPPQPPPAAYAPQPAFAPGPPAVASVAGTSGAAVIIDGGRPVSGPGSASPEATGTGPGGGAVRLSRRGTTVPQGSLVPAVLETALDSSRPGLVRAVVSQDVMSFNGQAVLIPRGSRLFGEYQADLAPGQNRAFVMWTRLVRPDGVAIALASPAADARGRTGIEGRVDNHFFERFTSALVQTTLNLGGAAASRSFGDTPVVVALPGSSQGAGATVSREIRPTLHVRAGQRVSVFIAQDLDLPPVRVR